MSARNLLLFGSDAGLALASVGTFTEVGTNLNTRRRFWPGSIQSYVRLQASFREAVTDLTFQIEYTEALVGQDPWTTLVTFEPITEPTVSLNLATEWIFIPEEFQEFERWGLVMRVMYHNNSSGALTMTYMALDLR